MKWATCVIISFFAAAVIAATGIAEESPLPSNNADPAETVSGEPSNPALGYKQALEKVMNLVFVYLDSLEKRNDINIAEKKQKAIDFIRNIRWGPENKYYFWINGLDGMMILEPLYPRTEGTNTIKYKDLNNREIFVEFISKSIKDGETFVDHNGLGYDTNENPKVSLVRLFEAWDWVVGTYVELDDIEAYEEPGELRFVIPLAPIDDQAPASAS